MTQITDAKLASLEEKAIMVESIFPDTTYAIDREGNGMWIISGNNVIGIDAENVEEFASDLVGVWKNLKVK